MGRLAEAGRAATAVRLARRAMGAAGAKAAAEAAMVRTKSARCIFQKIYPARTLP